MEDADVALGSRYVAGGGVMTGARGGAVSRCGSAYARVALGLQVRDATAGFKGFRRPVLESIDLDSVLSRRLRVPGRDHVSRHQRGFRVVEVPIVFRDRRVG